MFKLLVLVIVAGLEAGVATRTARLRTGDVTTTSKLKARRYLSAGSTNEDGEALYLLGLAPSSQEEVAAALEARNGSVLHYVPENHWLIRATSDAVQALLLQFAGITAAPYEPEYKWGESLDGLVGAVRSYKTAVAGVSSVTVASTTTASDNGEETEAWASNTIATAFAGTKRERKPRGLATFKSVLPPELTGILTQHAADGEVQVVLSILGSRSASEDSKAAAAAWAAELQAGLATELGHAERDACEPQVKVVRGASVARATVCVPDVEEATAWLIKQSSVTYVGTARTKKQKDLFANAAVQAGSIPDPRANLKAVGSAMPLWRAGLTGRGQIVAVADSGADMDSCYFYDPKYPSIVNNKTQLFYDREANLTYYKNTNHRKVVYYAFARDDATDGTGHGSHTSGNAVGSMYGYDPVTNPDLASGVAPGAKLAFYDAAGPEDGEDSLYIPDDSANEMYEPIYETGARIMSNSWGSDSFTFDDLECTILDSYIWARQDMLLFFAAGNDGDQTRYLASSGTVTSPANCKNALAVGATENWRGGAPRFNLLSDKNQQVNVSSSIFGPVSDVNQITFKTVTNGVATTQLTLDYGKDFLIWDGPPTSWVAVEPLGDLPVVLANPLLACDPLVGNYTGQVVLMIRGICNFSVKGSNAIAAGAAAVVLFDNTTGAMFSPYADTLGSSNIPFAYLPLTTGRQLQRILAAATPLFLCVTRAQVASPFDNVAYFSAFGPQASTVASTRARQDLRVKPDIMTPGYTRSASSDGSYKTSMDQCASESMVGTSMATPVAAGGAALVRQYFVDGFYPSGEKVAGAGFQPSGLLVRAVILGSAASMTGYSVTNGQRLQPAPSNFQGFGRMDLSRALPLKSNTGGWRLQVIDRALFQNTKSNHTYQVKATGEGPLIITLAWWDWPAFPGTLPPKLVNDLDLMVTGPSASTASGPSPNGTSVWWGNGARAGDGYNNVERVTIEAPVAGTYSITIIPYYLFIAARPQYYAMAVMGGISGTIASTQNPAYVRLQSQSTGGTSSIKKPQSQTSVSSSRALPWQGVSATSNATRVRRRAHEV